MRSFERVSFLGPPGEGAPGRAKRNDGIADGPPEVVKSQEEP